MVDLEQLAGQAQRAAILGRARMAARVALLVAPIALVALVAGGDVRTCACLAVALVAVTAGLRWWNRTGVDAVRVGLLMGLVPLTAALLLRGCSADCEPGAHLGPTELLCMLAGAIAGASVALRSRTANQRWSMWLLATGVASLTAALGCVGLGFGGLAATVAALVAGSAATWIPVTLRAA